MIELIFRQVLNSGIALSFALPLIGLPIIYAIPKSVIALFTSSVSDSLVKITTPMLWAAGAGVAADLVRITGSGAESALKRDTSRFVFNFVGLTGGLVFGLLAELVLGLGPVGMIAGFYLGVALAAGSQYVDIQSGIAHFDPRHIEAKKPTCTFQCFPVRVEVNSDQRLPLLHSAGQAATMPSMSLN